jgi:hypothetical protein
MCAGMSSAPSIVCVVQRPRQSVGASSRRASARRLVSVDGAKVWRTEPGPAEMLEAARASGGTRASRGGSRGAAPA